VTPPHSPAEITLVCWACDEKFTMRRRRGQYPRKCLVCRELSRDAGRARAAAERILRRLQRAGLCGAIIDHHLLAELANQPKAPAKDAA
jgi:hypothetical protein